MKIAFLFILAQIMMLIVFLHTVKLVIVLQLALVVGDLIVSSSIRLCVLKDHTQVEYHQTPYQLLESGRGTFRLF